VFLLVLLLELRVSAAAAAGPFVAAMRAALVDLVDMSFDASGAMLGVVILWRVISVLAGALRQTELV
jgi:hypothetical protein